ncbi:SRPBCC family protein [Rubritalea marina]|uniref:SRPBCC family protein n=1 Tax=Rubritalea marina TaxID=361055 RepID=UPI0003825AB1|nr:SRPBCC family protein [Rubritalea marina]
MSTYHASASISIRQDIDDVYAYLRDLNNWPEWSPWLVCDPEVKVSIDNTSYAWEGEFAGNGRIEILKEQPHRKIDFKMVMKRPWKARSHLALLLQEVDGETQVTMTRAGKLPFYLFWMKEVMQQLVLMEFQRGLRMLKDLMETGKVLSTVDFLGKQEVEGCYYVGVERHCAMESMEIAMREDFAMLMDWVNEQPDSLLDERGKQMFTLYDQWNLKHGVVHYRVCHPVKQLVDEVPHGFVRGKRDACAAQVIGHTGSYRHLANAWSAATVRAQGRIFRGNGRNKPFEKYSSFPSEVGESSSVTLVCIPEK